MSELKRKGVSPKGLVYYAHLNKPQVIRKSTGEMVETGRYTVSLKLDADAEKAMLAEIDEVWQQFKKDNPDKEYGETYMKCVQDTKDGRMFCFRKREQYKDSTTGEMVHTVVPIFDAYNHDISGQITSCGVGTEARISYEISPYYSNKLNHGVSLRLLAVQLLKYVPFVPSRSAERYGFKTVEGGYNAEMVNEGIADEEVPF